MSIQIGEGGRKNQKNISPFAAVAVSLWLFTPLQRAPDPERLDPLLPLHKILPLCNVRLSSTSGPSPPTLSTVVLPPYPPDQRSPLPGCLIWQATSLRPCPPWTCSPPTAGCWQNNWMKAQKMGSESVGCLPSPWRTPSTGNGLCTDRGLRANPLQKQPRYREIDRMN